MHNWTPKGIPIILIKKNIDINAVNKPKNIPPNINHITLHTHEQHAQHMVLSEDLSTSFFPNGQRT